MTCFCAQIVNVVLVNFFCWELYKYFNSWRVWFCVPVQNWPSGSVKDWPDVTGRSVTDWLEMWSIDQKLQAWHGKHRPEVIDQKCEGLTRSVKNWPEVCVWNMIDQKCEGLTRIDTENSFQFDQLRSLNNRILFSPWDPVNSQPFWAMIKYQVLIMLRKMVYI